MCMCRKQTPQLMLLVVCAFYRITGEMWSVIGEQPSIKQ